MKVIAQEKGQLLENVFADPKGFGIAPNGQYRYQLPGKIPPYVCMKLTSPSIIAGQELREMGIGDPLKC